MNRILLKALVCLLISATVVAQPDHIRKIFPEGTRFHQNLPYSTDTLKKHLLDIYLPPGGSGATPLIIWIHGGGWNHNDKYADMSYMTSTIREIVSRGYALASIDYRFSTTAIFPAQIKDCNQAIQFLHDQAGKYNFDPSKFVIMGFSAGGHLGNLVALSRNNTVSEFHAGRAPTFNIRGVVDFYGPSNFLLFFGAATDAETHGDPISMLLGASPLKRPDISAKASPVTYVDKHDPPFFIVHGEKDDGVPLSQALLLKSTLDVAGVSSELHIVKGAPHFGPMFDAVEVRTRIFDFLDKLFAN